MITAASNGAIVRGQAAQGSDPGLPEAEFLPGRLPEGLESARRRQARVRQRADRPHARDEPRRQHARGLRRRDESSAATGVNGNQKDDTVRRLGRGLRLHARRRRTGRGRSRRISRRRIPTRYDSFGFSLALNGDGNTLAVTRDARGQQRARHQRQPGRQQRRGLGRGLRLRPRGRQVVAAGLRQVVEHRRRRSVRLVRRR